MPLTVLQACIVERVPYIDVADDRDFVCRAYALVESEATPHGMIALIGCSVVPGLTSLLTRFAQTKVPRIVQTKICISPGTQHTRTAEGTGGPLPACFPPLKKIQCASGRRASVRHRMDRARAGYFPAPMGNRTGVPRGGYCRPFYSTTLFPNPYSGVQDRVRTACTQTCCFQRYAG